ncbi:CLUMA_CG021523, isoform A [Clunio marinus]|uniref:CLUMA_CG021523, isoform A n=1 Tax=Clunio marinus TaxID=568069 RepID=A0A1J1J9V7_9DIPT|nr:CLUMA_CG021523, isoform A [Clunio marinus]
MNKPLTAAVKERSVNMNFLAVNIIGIFAFHIRFNGPVMSAFRIFHHFHITFTSKLTFAMMHAISLNAMMT